MVSDVANISFLKTINKIEVQKYLLGINGLKYSEYITLY